MSEPIYAGLTSQSIDVMLRDSTSTTGAGLAGLVYNTSGLKAYYRKGATGTPTAITLATQTVGGAFSSGGFVEVDSTNMAGVYRLDLPNAAVDTEGFVTLFIYGATNLVPTAQRIDCRALPADVKKYGGTAGTFSSGRPEVNTTHVAGTSQTAGDIPGILGALNASASSGDPGTTTTLVAYLKQIINTLEGTAGIPTFPSAAAPGNAVSLAEAIRSIYTQVGVAGAGLTSVGDTRMANLDAAISTRLATSGYTAPDNSTIATINTKLGTPAASVSADIAAVKTDTGNLVNRITANLFAGITYLSRWLGAIAGKTADTGTRAEINATTAGASYNETTDSLEANRDNIGTAGAGLTSVSGGGGGLTQQNIDDIAAEVVADLTGQQITIVNPYPSGGTVRTVQNTAYKNSLGNRIEWPDINGTWPVLTGATITIKIGQGGTPLTFTGTVITGTGSTKRVGLELEEADSLSIDATDTTGGSWTYIVTATISGDVMKLAEGKWISVPQPT